MTLYNTGLIVGKFCPLHKGHEYLIDIARKSCARLVIISYAKPGYAGCGTEKRRLWLEKLYPDTNRLVVDDIWMAQNARSEEFTHIPPDDADELTHRRFTSWLCHTILGETIDAVFTSEDYGEGFAQVLSDYQSAPTVHVCVDKARETIPISGTRIRENLGKYRNCLSDVVYVSFVKKAVFLGGESTGKSSLARELAARMDTKFAAEYGRELWETKDGELVYEDMVHIAQTQLAREGALAAKSRDWLFCDTSPLTTLFYSNALFGKADRELEALSHAPYDMTFLCAPDFDFVQDGTRQNARFRQQQHEWYIEALTERQIEYTILNGPIDLRIERVLEMLRASAEKGGS